MDDTAPRGDNGGINNGLAPRSRSRVACQSCNRRKVRCDVTATGVPCTNCQHDGGACQVLPRKKHRPRRTRAGLPATPLTARDDRVSAYPSATHRRSTRQSVSAIQDDLHQRIDFDDTHASLGHPTPVTEPRAQVSSTSAAGPGAGGYNALMEETQEGDSILPDDSSVSYIGDNRGPRQSVYDLCHPGAPQDARPYMPQRASGIAHKPHEIEYMRHQGVFASLPSDVCDELIRCYFQHVHFFLPIVDVPSFLNAYVDDGSQKTSKLLLWSMFLAAANFADANILKRAGFSSRKSMKTAMYERAKCLYDLDRGTDKLILIQSVILLGFWYTDPQDHTGAWYWTGIAICLSQSIGLHRLHRITGRTQETSSARHSLMRRIWWTCVVRDRWVSLAKGRPMRIHSEDCDTPMPISTDILHELELLASSTRSRFIPANSDLLASMWIRLVKISDILGSILRLHYRVNGADPSVADIDRHARELRSCAGDDMLGDDENEMLYVHRYQLDLFYQATVTILYRPYVLSGSVSLPVGADKGWRKTIAREAHEAASNTNALLESLIQLGAIKYLKQMIITALIPAMQIHLADCKSTNPLIRGLGANKLELCMLVLSNLRETYWSAGVMYRLFGRAHSILKESNPSESTTRIGKMASNQNSESFVRAVVQQPQQPQQQEQDEVGSILIREPSLQMNDEAPPWPNIASHFCSVDQLLSPGFSLSESVFPDFFPAYDSSMAYNEAGASDMGGDMVYNI